MAKSAEQKAAEAAEAEAARFQVPAERPEDSLDFRTDEVRAADEQIAKDYPEKTDDAREDASAPALSPDDPRVTGEGTSPAE